jgi:crotonobetainyl-CoA:carnitine CoA-transferase CaiB-like acyl-CoA transferase
VRKSALENIDMAEPQAQHVLSGYRVLDFSQYIAGPTVTRMMAEMGAEVIKVEMAPKGDQTRGMPYLKDNRSGYFVQQNLGKKSLCIDIRRDAGLNIIKELIPRMDVVVENFGPGTIKRLGLGYEVVKALNPKIVMCSVSTFGQDGPLANQPGWDFIGACYSGVIDMVGERDQTPFRRWRSATPAPEFTRWPPSHARCSTASAAVSDSISMSACWIRTSPTTTRECTRTA